MHILFVVSGNKVEISPIVLNQANSLSDYSSEYKVSFYLVKGKGIFGYLKNITGIRKAVFLLNPDIIHAHYSFSGYLTTLALFPKKIVVSLMGSDTNLNKISRIIVSLFAVFCWRKVIVKSERMKTSLSCKNVVVLPNGVDFDRFKPMPKLTCQEKVGFDKTKKHVVFFLSSPDRTEKNVELAKKAHNELKDARIDLHVISYVNQELIPYYLNAADVLLLTSFYEGSPNIIKEAMACCTPIVSTDVGDVSKVISNTNYCYICSYDASDIALKLKTIVDVDSRTNGRSNISYLNRTEIARQLIEIYNSL